MLNNLHRYVMYTPIRGGIDSARHARDPALRCKQLLIIVFGFIHFSTSSSSSSSTTCSVAHYERITSYAYRFA